MNASNMMRAPPVSIPISILNGYNHKNFTIAYNQQFPIFANGGSERIILWKVKQMNNSESNNSFRVIKSFSEHEGSVLSLAFHPEFPILASASGDNTVKIWSIKFEKLQESKCEVTLTGHKFRVLIVAFHPKLPILVTGSEDSTIKLWNIDIEDFSKTSLIKTIEQNVSSESMVPINSIVFHPNGNIFVSGDSNGQIKIFDLNGKCLQTRRENRGTITSIAFHHDNILLTGSADKKSYLWSLNQEKTWELNLVKEITEDSSVVSVAFHPKFPIFAICKKNTIELYNFSSVKKFTVRPIQTIIKPNIEYYSIAFSPDGSNLTCGCKENIIIWKLNDKGIAVDGPTELNENSLGNSINSWNGKKIIKIPKIYITDFNSKNNSCGNSKAFYKFIMGKDIKDSNIKFEIEGQSGQDISGISRRVLSLILPIYIDTYFNKIGEEEFLILKSNIKLGEKLSSRLSGQNNKDSNITRKFIEHTYKLINIAFAAESQIFLNINPRLLELLLSDDARQFINNSKRENFRELFNNLEKEINDYTTQEVNSCKGYFIRNHTLQNFNMNSLLVKGTFQSLENSIKREIRFRKFAMECGFKEGKEFDRMQIFISEFWNKEGYEIFTNKLAFDLDSMKRRLHIIIINRDMDESEINFSEIMNRNNSEIFSIYPYLKPLLKYISEENEEGNIKRKKFIKFVTGSETSISPIKIKLVNSEIPFKTNKETKIFELPFLVHTCSSTIDLYRIPEDYKESEPTNKYINDEISKGISQLAFKN